MTNQEVLHGLDLFSGIGGITKALEGYVEPIAYCEIDPYARGVLLSRMASGDIPDVPIWDDVASLRGSMLPRVDIIYGGFPCQDISVAGRGKGLEGKRSGLFFKIIRLVKEIRPAFVFLENVPAIRRRGLDRVLEEFTALRYDCRWGMLAAQDMGANHKRERWFLLAHSICESNRAQIDGEKIVEKNAARPTSRIGGSSTNVANTESVRFQRRSSFRNEVQAESMQLLSTGQGEFGGKVNPSHWWAAEPNVGRVAHGIPKRVDRLRALGNAVVPQQAREAFERLMGLK